MTRITLKDVAAKAGVSYQTVSKVLKGQGTVSSETEKRIWDAVADLDYRPNINAQNLRTQISNMIGHAIPGHHQLERLRETENPITQQFTSSAAYAAEHYGFNLLTFVMKPDNYYDTTPYDLLYMRNQVAGFVISGTIHDDPRIKHLISRRIPFSSFGRANDSWDFCWVDVDGRAGIYDAVTHLFDRGHKKIAMLTWPDGALAGSHREEGYFAAMEAAGLPINPRLLMRLTSTVEDGSAAVAHLLSLPKSDRPTAIVCITDIIAIGAMNGIAQAGLTVGQDVAITGFDDLPMTEYLHPALTSVRQPLLEIGQHTVDMVMKQIKGEPVTQPNVLLKPRLVVRASS